jgi:hypothetical protein
MRCECGLGRQWMRAFAIQELVELRRPPGPSRVLIRKVAQTLVRAVSRLVLTPGARDTLRGVEKVSTRHARVRTLHRAAGRRHMDAPLLSRSEDSERRLRAATVIERFLCFSTSS